MFRLQPATVLVLACTALFGTVSAVTANISAIPDEATWYTTVESVLLADFEGFIGPVTDEYPGVIFSDFNGNSPRSVAFQPFRGENSMFARVPDTAGGGGWAAEFSPALKGVAFWSLDLQWPGTIIKLYDEQQNVLGEFDLYDSGGGHCCFIWGFNGFVSTHQSIARIEISIKDQDAVWFDNISGAYSWATGSVTLAVENVQVTPRPLSTIYDVTYDLQTIRNTPVTVSLFLSMDNGASYPHLCQHVAGDVGAGVMSGSARHIVWDVGLDFPGGLVSSECKLRIIADDSDYADNFVYIPPGTFIMGSPSNEPGRFTNEGPQHQVTLTQGFYMSKYEVTEEWWQQVMGGTTTISQLPKGYVSWDMAVLFCNALSRQAGLTPAYTFTFDAGGCGPNGNVTWHQEANGYRLPTEAEWEYACRATTTMAYNNDTNCLSSNTEANFRGDSNQLPGCPTGVYLGARTEVGSFPPNLWGLYDLHGNIWEWVWCGSYREYTEDAVVDPVHNVGPGVARVLRGGNWPSWARYSRSAQRNHSFPGTKSDYSGFRPVRSAF